MSSALSLARSVALPATALSAGIAGLIAWPIAGRPTADAIWLVAVIVVGAPVMWRTVRSVLRGQFATDVVAALAIAAAIALREPLAGLVVVLMQTGGEALERYAEGRASAAVRALEDAAPRTAHRLLAAGEEEIPVERIAVGDRLLVRPGGVVPCDGDIVEGESELDTARLTGESVPRSVAPGAPVLSGMLNGSGAFVMRATAVAGESQYARIVELVRSAETSKSPLQRLADRYAAWFTPVTLVSCAVVWIVTRDPVRILAVLVVATPCPLILATPIAIIGGINRAAARLIVVRNGTALERLSDAEVAVFDKTGTLTEGQPRVSRVLVHGGLPSTTVLRLAAAVEQRAGHLLARSLVAVARESTGPLPQPTRVQESPGGGVEGDVEGHVVSVGSRAYMLRRLSLPADAKTPFDHIDSSLRALVAIDGVLQGAIDFHDMIRPSAAPLVARLPSLGIGRVLLLSGDNARSARLIAEAVGIEEAEGDLLPGDKMRRIAELSQQSGRVLMVGDGTNDAPALRRADVGIALAGHGGGITAEAADVVILIDDLSRVGDAMRIAQQTMSIARQSIVVGLGLSLVGMLAAALGYLPPVGGALVQEGIDVAVILNALRSSRDTSESEG